MLQLCKKLENFIMIALDQIDRNILSLLQADCRLTLNEIADRVGLSVSPCHRRIKRMEENGVVLRYAAMVDQRAVGLPVSVFVSIKLDRQKEQDLERFAKAIASWPEVVECYLMTGPRDYLLRVVVADLVAYEQFLKQKLTRLDGLSSIESSFALDQVKFAVSLPL
jgi:Lrp/AsnC family leucine-responsive transcriptional regulator